MAFADEFLFSFHYGNCGSSNGHHSESTLKEYDQIFTNAPPVNALGKTNPQELLDQFLFMERRSIGIIKSLSPQNLESKLEPVPVPHPIAKNKFEALDWKIKHTMWHCRQLGILKRILDKRFDFGLKKAH